MDADEATLRMIEALEAAGIPYMLVGSLSSNYYGIARATQDADFVIDLGERSIAELMQHLGPEFRLDPQISFDTIIGTTRHIIHISEIPFRIELFRVSDDPHDQERFRRRVQIDTGEGTVWLPRVEDVVVTKLYWAHHGRRVKDREDLRDVIAVRGDAIDWDYVHAWCERHGTRELLEEIRRSIPPI